MRAPKKLTKLGRGIFYVLIAVVATLGLIGNVPVALASPDVPNAPTDLWTENQVNPTEITDFSPEFSAIFTDNDAGDNAENIEIWVGTTDEDNDMWASGWMQFTDHQEIYYGAFGMHGGSITKAGQRKTIENQKIIRLGFLCRKWSSPSGDITFTVRKEMDHSIIQSKVWGDASELPTDYTWCEVTFDNPPLINETVYLYFEYSGPAEVTVKNTAHVDVKANEYTVINYSPITDEDTTYRLYYLTENNQRCFDVSYAGSALSRGVTYYWKCRFMNQDGTVGAWSTETATFKITTWILIESWTGTVRIAYNLIESWTGTVRAPAAWNLIESWTGTVRAVVWNLIESWTGTVRAPTVWNLIESWTGTVKAPGPPPPPPPVPPITEMDVIIFITPLVLICLAVGFGNSVFAFFGGTAAIFTGVYYIDTIWAGMIFMGLGIYFVVAAFYLEKEGG